MINAVKIGTVIVNAAKTGVRSIEKAASKRVPPNLSQPRKITSNKGMSKPVLITGKVLSPLEKRILTVRSEDELIILGQEINKLSGTNKPEIIAKYIQAYKNFYTNCYKGKKISPKNIFNTIFGKNLTEKESLSLCQKYKSIMKEPNLEKYVERLFSQLKKDFGMEYLPVKLKQNILEGCNLGIRANTSVFLDSIEISYFKDSPLVRHKLFGLLVHELTHAKQQEISVAVDFSKYVQTLADKLHKMPANKDISIDYIRNIVANKIGRENLQNIRKMYGIIEEGSALHKRGLSYINEQGNYQSVGTFTEEAFKRYKQQLLEKEAYNAQSKANELYYYLTHLFK